LLLVLVAAVASVALYSRLPASVPTHWDLQGQPNGETAKPIGPFVGPLLMLGIVVLFAALPKISPRGYLLEQSPRTTAALEFLTVAFVGVMHGVVLLGAAGIVVSMKLVLDLAAGLLLIGLGNYMSKLTRNFFFGIRTPWTLASEEVWLRTHRLGGLVLVAAGVVLLAGAPFGIPPAVIITVIAVAAAIPVLYSYVIYRRVEHRAPLD
jgi:uncharacterized membrane protein